MSNSELLKANVDLSKEVDSKILESILALNQGVVPDYAVSEHPGKGGRNFKYVKHTWVTEQLRNVLGQLWSFDVLSTTVFEDGSVAAMVKLSLQIPLREGGFLQNSITEVGVFDGGGGKMPKASMVASAVSRGLVRCVMRRFGLGQQFYDEEGPEPTTQSAWNALLKYGTYRGLSERDIIQALKGANIRSPELLDRFNEAYEVIGRAIAQAKEEPIPEELK